MWHGITNKQYCYASESQDSQHWDALGRFGTPSSLQWLWALATWRLGSVRTFSFLVMVMTQLDIWCNSKVFHHTKHSVHNYQPGNLCYHWIPRSSRPIPAAQGLIFKEGEAEGLAEAQWIAVGASDWSWHEIITNMVTTNPHFDIFTNRFLDPRIEMLAPCAAAALARRSVPELNRWQVIYAVTYRSYCNLHSRIVQQFHRVITISWSWWPNDQPSVWTGSQWAEIHPRRFFAIPFLQTTE